MILAFSFLELSAWALLCVEVWVVDDGWATLDIDWGVTWTGNPGALMGVSGNGALPRPGMTLIAYSGGGSEREGKIVLEHKQM